MEDKKFKLKIGYCYVLPDKIVIARTGGIDGVNNKKEKNRIVITFAFYIIIAAFFIWKGVNAYEQSRFISSFLWFAFGSFLALSVVFSWNNSSSAIIDRSKIKSITLNRGVKRITRARIIVIFENENGKLKKRLIMLAGNLSHGDDALDNASRILQEEGFLQK